MSMHRSNREEDQNEPLLNNSQQVVQIQRNIKGGRVETANVLSRIFFSWVTPLARVR